MSTKKCLRIKAWPGLTADSFTAIYDLIVYKMCGASISHNPIGLHGLIQGYIYVVTLFIYWTPLSSTYGAEMKQQ
jgi:hypothetical protein